MYTNKTSEGKNYTEHYIQATKYKLFLILILDIKYVTYIIQVKFKGMVFFHFLTGK